MQLAPRILTAGVILLFLCSAACAAPVFTDADALKMMPGQMIQKLQGDLPALITSADRANMRGGWPYEPNSPGALKYYTRAYADYPAICKASEILLQYDEAGRPYVTTTNVFGPIPAQGAAGMAECAAMNSQTFFTAPNAETARQVDIVIQRVKADAQGGPAPGYQLTCSPAAQSSKTCTSQILNAYLPHLEVGRISSAVFMDCDSNARMLPYPSSAVTCIKVLLDDSTFHFFRALIKIETANGEPKILSVDLTQGGRVY